MSEYTVTYPIHLGQEVWVDEKIVRPKWEWNEYQTSYLTGSIVGFTIWKHGELEHRSMHIMFDDERVPATPETRAFRIGLYALGQTVFDKNPEA